jgi:GST-like protein
MPRDFPHLAAWFERIGRRPATERADALAKDINTTPTINYEELRRLLFGQDASAVR